MTTTDESPITRTLTIHREVSAVVAMTFGASAAMIETGGDPSAADVRVVLEVVAVDGERYLFEFAVDDVTAIRSRLDAAEVAAAALRGLHS